MSSSMVFYRSNQLYGRFSHVVDDWERTIDPGSTFHACFLDVAKAFHRVNYTLLEHTLSTVGVKAKELSWFVSFLNQRSMCTSIDGCKSSLKVYLVRCSPRFRSGPSAFYSVFPRHHGLVLSPLHVLRLRTILSCMTVAMASALINRVVVWKKTPVLSMPGLATGVPHLRPLSLHTCSSQASAVGLEMQRVHPCPCRPYYTPGEDDCSSWCSDLKHSLMVRPREQYQPTVQVQNFFAETPDSSSQKC